MLPRLTSSNPPRCRFSTSINWSAAQSKHQPNDEEQRMSGLCDAQSENGSGWYLIAVKAIPLALVGGQASRITQLPPTPPDNTNARFSHQDLR